MPQKTLERRTNQEPAPGTREETSPETTPARMTSLQRAAGNRAVTRLLRSRNARTALDAGRPLPDDVRADMEARFGADFDGVRVHTGGDADAGAEALAARAFTFGNDIAFRRHAFAPGTPAGRRLLSHELAHVLQQRRGGGRRPTGHPAVEGDAARAARDVDAGVTPQVTTGTAPGIACQSDPVVSREPQIDPTSRAGANATTPPGTLTNDELLSRIRFENDWLASKTADDLEYEKHSSRLLMLEAEREARLAAGHLWLTDEGPVAKHYVLLPDPSADVTTVAEVLNAGSFTGTTALPGPIVSEGQFAAALSGLGIPVTTPGATPIGGIGASRGLASQPGYAGYSEVFARGYSQQTLDIHFQGELGEFMFGSRAPNAPGRTDLNTRAWRAPRSASPATLESPKAGNFPVYDWLEGSGERVSNKMSLGDAAERYKYFDTGWNEMTNKAKARASGYTAFDMAVFNLEPAGSLKWPPDSPTLNAADRAAWTAARERALRLGRLAVNADDVVAYRQRVSQRLQSRSAQHSALINAYLAAAPETRNGVTFTTLAQINAAPASDRTVLLASLADRIASTQVVSGQVTTAAGRRLQAIRGAMGLEPVGQGTDPRPGVRGRAFPEVFLVGEHGYGGAMRRTAPGGAAVGGTGSIILLTAETAAREGRLPTVEEYAVSGGGGMLGGAGGAALETAVQARLAQSALARGLTGGLGPAAGATGGSLLVRGIGGGAAGSVVAPVITLGTMAYYDLTNPLYNPTGADYFSKGGRAFVVGGASGFLTSALTFAMFGAALGPLGILVGFVIGVGTYLLIDYMIGQQVETGLRSIAE